MYGWPIRSKIVTSSEMLAHLKSIKVNRCNFFQIERWFPNMPEVCLSAEATSLPKVWKKFSIFFIREIGINSQSFNRRCANRVKLWVDKFWAQLTPPPNQFSHWILPYHAKEKNQTKSWRRKKSEKAKKSKRNVRKKDGKKSETNFSWLQGYRVTCHIYILHPVCIFTFNV